MFLQTIATVCKFCILDMIHINVSTICSTSCSDCVVLFGGEGFVFRGFMNAAMLDTTVQDPFNQPSTQVLSVTVGAVSVFALDSFQSCFW